jgi:hypothetical protein
MHVACHLGRGFVKKPELVVSRPKNAFPPFSAGQREVGLIGRGWSDSLQALGRSDQGVGRFAPPPFGAGAAARRAVREGWRGGEMPRGPVSRPLLD